MTLSDILFRLEKVINSAIFVRTELKKRQKNFKALCRSADDDKGLARFFANSIFGLNLICTQTKALRRLIINVTRMSNYYSIKECIPISTSAQRKLLFRYAKGLYRYPEGKFHGHLLIPMKYYEEVLARCFNGLFEQNAMFARSIRRELAAQR